MKILLICRTDKHENSGATKITDIFSKDKSLVKHQLSVRKEPLSENTNTEGAELLIIDISSAREEKERLITLLKSLSGADVPKLLVLASTQFELLREIHKYPIKINDFVFIENLAAELTVRIENIIFRNFKEIPANSIILDEMILDLDKYELLINGKKIELTFKEYQLLKILLENKNKVFTRTQLLSAVWDYDYYGGSRTVDVHMRRLRAKMDLPYSDMLKTVRNVGYMFSP